MSVRQRALRHFRRGSANAGELPINLVPMIDILTVLVLYLLVGSIAQHLAILGLNLPNPDAPPPTEAPPLQLTVVIRPQRLQLYDSSGPIREFARDETGTELPALGTLLHEIKQRAPNETTITVLLEPEVPYDALVQVMDTVRLAPVTTETVLPGEMFPDISIGDAPPLAPGAVGTPGAAAPAPAAVPVPTTPGAPR